MSTKTPPLFLKYAKNKYSQHGEDGILSWLFRQLNVKQGMFVEFGAWDGIHLSNCRALFEQGWHGVFIEGDKKRFRHLKENYQHEKNIVTVQAYIETEGENSLDALFQKHAIQHIDFLSIDVDSIDLAIWKSLKTIRPTVVCIEYNPTIPFDVKHEATTDDPATCSAPLSIDTYARSQNYSLVAATHTNLIFMHNEKKQRVESFHLHDMRDFLSDRLRCAFAPDGRILFFHNDILIKGELIKMPWTGYLMKQPMPAWLRGNSPYLRGTLRKFLSRLSCVVFRPFSFFVYTVKGLPRRFSRLVTRWKKSPSSKA